MSQYWWVQRFESIWANLLVCNLLLLNSIWLPFVVFFFQTVDLISSKRVYLLSSSLFQLLSSSILPLGIGCCVLCMCNSVCNTNVQWMQTLCLYVRYICFMHNYWILSYHSLLLKLPGMVSQKELFLPHHNSFLESTLSDGLVLFSLSILCGQWLLLFENIVCTRNT